MSKPVTFKRGRVGHEELDVITQVMTSGEFSSFYREPYGGGWVRRFEREFAEYIGVEHAVSVSNGTLGLLCASLACGIGKGDKVITTPYTFAATASMIVACGAKPVFVDVDPGTYNIDPEKIEEAVTAKTKAVVPVHLIGQPCDMNSIMDIAEDHNLYVIEDACQSLGSEYYGVKTGALGDVGVFSFQETKQITTLGEGGMVVTDDAWIAENCRRIRNCGCKYFKDPLILGFNLRMTEAQAAMGVVQLKKLDLFNEIQIQNAKYVIERLPEAITPPHIEKYAKHTFYIIGCLYNEEKAGMTRNAFLERVNQKGLNKLVPGGTVGGGYSELVYQLPYFNKYFPQKQPCTTAESLVEKALWFDYNRYPHTFEDMDRLVNGFKEILN